MKTTKKAHAKINLTLDVLNKRSDGYHNIVSIMQTLALCDTVTLEKAASGITCGWNADREFTKDNTAYRAAELMLRRYNINGGVSVNIDKFIPFSAGLGGGSADAAAVIEGMNELFELGVPQSELLDAGMEIGADVPFCMFKGAAVAEGIGERLTRINSGVNCYVVVVKPDIEISTKDSYEKIDHIELKHRPNTNAAIAAMKAADIKNLGRNIQNVFELIMDEHAIISELKRSMVFRGSCGTLMSGSGPAVYGLFESRLLAENARACIKGDFGFETFSTVFYYPDRPGRVDTR